MYIKLKVHPGSRKREIVKKASDSFEVWVKAEAERGLATEEALLALAGAIGVEVKKLRLVKGATSPSKIIQLFE